MTLVLPLPQSVSEKAQCWERRCYLTAFTPHLWSVITWGKTEAINKMSPVLPSCQENWLQLECELKRLAASSRLHYLRFFWNELEQLAPATRGSYWAAEPEWKGQLALDPAHSARTWSLYWLKRDSLFICSPVTAGQNNFPDTVAQYHEPYRLH